MNALQWIKQQVAGMFKRLNVRTVMWLQTAIVILVMLGMALCIMLIINLQRQAIEGMDNPIASGESTGLMRMQAANWQRAWLAYLANGNKSEIADAHEAGGLFYEQLGEQLDWYADHPSEGADYLAQLQESASIFNSLHDMLDATERSSVNHEQFEALSSDMLLNLTGLAAQQRSDARDVIEDVSVHAGHMIRVVGVLLLVIILLFVATSCLVSRMILARLGPCQRVLESWASASMAPRVISISGRDDPFTRTAHAINRYGDLNEVFLHEMHATLDAMAVGLNDRRICTDGFTWELKASALAVNNSIDQIIKHNAKADTDQQELTAFQKELELIAGNLSTVADEMATRSATVLENATAAATQSEASSREAEQVSSGMQESRKAMADLADAIREVSRHICDAAEMTDSAVEEAANTQASMDRLTSASAKVGEVVELINSIADQTRMLSLNATIEAARAGEAGLGFAVVASEVKQLAAATAEETGRIEKSIAEIQQASGEAVEAIGRISSRIGDTSRLMGEAGRMIEIQNETSGTVSANVDAAATGGDNALKGIEQVHAGAEQTSGEATRMAEAAENLRASIAELTTAVENYTGKSLEGEEEIELF